MGIGCMVLLWLCAIPVILILVALLAIHVDENLLQKTQHEDVITVTRESGVSFLVEDSSSLETSYSVVFASSGKEEEVSVPEMWELKPGRQYDVVYRVSKLFGRVELVAARPLD